VARKKARQTGASWRGCRTRSAVRCGSRAGEVRSRAPVVRRREMQPSDIQRAVAATRSVASTLRLEVDDATVVHNSNRIAVRLLPCDVLARVAGPANEATAMWRTRYGLFQPGPEFEVDVARRLADTDSPIAGLDPRVEPR